MFKNKDRILTDFALPFLYYRVYEMREAFLGNGLLILALLTCPLFS